MRTTPIPLLRTRILAAGFTMVCLAAVPVAASGQRVPAGAAPLAAFTGATPRPAEIAVQSSVTAEGPRATPVGIRPATRSAPHRDVLQPSDGSAAKTGLIVGTVAGAALAAVLGAGDEGLAVMTVIGGAVGLAIGVSKDLATRPRGRTGPGLVRSAPDQATTVPSSNGGAR